MFGAKHVGLVSIHERIDTIGPMGRFTLHIMGAVAQLERETIAYRVSSAMAHLRAQGNNVGGRVPIGATVIGEKGAKMLKLDEATAPAVLAAFHSMRASMGGSCRGSCDLFDAGVYRKLPTPTVVGRAMRNESLVELGEGRPTARPDLPPVWLTP